MANTIIQNYSTSVETRQHHPIMFHACSMEYRYSDCAGQGKLPNILQSMLSGERMMSAEALSCISSTNTKVERGERYKHIYIMCVCNLCHSIMPGFGHASYEQEHSWKVCTPNLHLQTTITCMKAEHDLIIECYMTLLQQHWRHSQWCCGWKRHMRACCPTANKWFPKVCVDTLVTTFFFFNFFF